MAELTSIIIHVFLFIALYFQVFLLATFFEGKQKMELERRRGAKKPPHYPSVCIIVPCFNEERSVAGTLRSLLALDYPKKRLQIIVVDDGSTDNTYAEAEKFTVHPQVELYRKENGGKYTALNLGLEKCRSELVGCLDADSFVDEHALTNIVRYFEDPSIMAVTPTIKVHEPRTFLQLIQNSEYHMSIFLRKMFGMLNALHVPAGVSDVVVRRRLLQEHDLEIGAGFGALAGQIWRIGLMGAGATEWHVRTCINALGEVLESEGARVDRAAAGEALQAAYAGVK
jgi:cellulose synthase/poly-beta-1,6-N-acetylglucosamine synthase-like glycosyltransferase